MLGNLYIVATPIGNLEDITLRAIRVLSEVDAVLAEDTRVSQKLLAFVASRQSLVFSNDLDQRPTTNRQRLVSYHQHSSEEKKLEILKMLMDGKNLALITDAGTPGISDPGSELVEYLISYLPSQAGQSDLNVIPIPGPSAVAATLSVSGFDASKFMFIGFWPKKKAGKVIELIKLTKLNTVFYESPYRIVKTLKLLEKELGSDIKVLVARELTKMHETLYRGRIRGILSKLSTEKIKGEIVVMVEIL